MCELFGVGFVLLPFGVALGRYPFEIAELSEQHDAVGSLRDVDDVEPADWRVSMTRVVGDGLLTIAGLLLVAGLGCALLSA